MERGSPLVLKIDAESPDESIIARAAQILRGGGLVVFPTETVYGLAADGTNPAAVERLNRVKGRPPEKPYSVHLHEAAQVREFVRAVPPLAQRLMAKFWPGPVTIVMPLDNGQTIGFRLPDHAVARAFLRRCATRVVAPSANRSGEPPPTDPTHIATSLGKDFDCLLDAGPTPVGHESTVVQVVGGELRILREGAVPAQAIAACVARA